MTEEYNSDKEASHQLHKIGIRGIKYLDGSSRSAGEGSYNYVIFDDKDVSITAKFSHNPDVGALPKSEWLSAAQITQVIEERLAQFPHQPKVLIRDAYGSSFADERGGVIKGMTRGDSITLFRNGLADSADVTTTLWHELLHYGPRRVMTKEQYIPAMHKLYNGDAWIKWHADLEPRFPIGMATSLRGAKRRGNPEVF